jgi:hypothetical protein
MASTSVETANAPGSSGMTCSAWLQRERRFRRKPPPNRGSASDNKSEVPRRSRPMAIDRLTGERAYLSCKNRRFLNFFRSVNQFTRLDDSLR